MANSQSIRSSNRARITERGFALAIALILAVLYFGLIELLMIDSSRELAAARRFRAQIVAQTLAENAAEGAALHLADKNVGAIPFAETDDQGRMTGSAMKTENGFVLDGTGVSAGLESTKARVVLRGTITTVGTARKITVDFSQHSQ